MTTYISKVAKNGKMQYFRIDEDGKKKMVKRGEYEANMPADGQGQLGIDFSDTSATFAEIEIPASVEPEAAPEPIPARPTVKTSTVENPFDFVKAAVADFTGRYKLTYKVWKKYGSIYYRSCAICGFFYDESGNVTAARFMGTTLESRKTFTEVTVASSGDWQEVTESVLNQIRFVNEWWGLSEKSKEVA